MQQLELFPVTPLGFILFASWASKRAMFDASPELYYESQVIRKRIADQVARAMFIAKVDGDEYSRYPRR